MRKSNFRPEKKSPLRLGSALSILFPVLLAVGLIYWLAPKVGTPSYPEDWAAPQLFLGSLGGCPDITGTYDNVSEVVPQLLQGRPAWERGVKGWYEHKATVSQAADGSTLTLQFALNERGLPKHRDQVMTFNQAWPTGGTLELKRGVNYRCSGRFIRVEGGNDTFVSKDRDGHLIVGNTFRVSGKWSFYNLSGGPEFVNKTNWYRWKKRPSGSDAFLQREYSFEVNRFPWLNNNDTEVVVKTSNYEGENLCVRVWDLNAARPDDVSANAELATGYIDSSGKCPAPWRFLWFPGSESFTLKVAGANYRIARYPVANPGATPTVIDVGRPTEIALMPDQDEVMRLRRLAETTPEQRAMFAKNERLRIEQRARETAELAAFKRKQAELASRKTAKAGVIQARLTEILNKRGSASSVRIEDGKITVVGDALSNADVSTMLRAIAADPASSVELVSLTGGRDGVQFEILFKPSRLSDP